MEKHESDIALGLERLAELVDEPELTEAAEEAEEAEAAEAATEGGLPLPVDTSDPPDVSAAPDLSGGKVAPKPPPPAEAATSKPPQGTRRISLDHPLVQDLIFSPRHWRIWPTVAVLRWVLRQAPVGMRRLVYRSLPTLSFATAEIEDVAIQTAGAGSIELTMGAAGIANDGSPLPSSDIARIIANRERGGGLAQWLDMPGDRFMHQAEFSLARHSAAFALATGGDIRAVSSTADLVGRSAPLTADPGGVLMNTWKREPVGAVGLAAMFMGNVSATGLAGVLGAFTSLSVLIEEFAGAEVPILRSTRVGGRFGGMLGRKCVLPSAGVGIVVRGGSRVHAQEWAQQPRRRTSLYRLAHAYIGSHVPRARIYLTLDADNAPPAKLGHAALGGLAVLGKASKNVRLPLADRNRRGV